LQFPSRGHDEGGDVKGHSGHEALEAPEVQGREREHELRHTADESGHQHGHADDHGGHAGHAEVYRRRFWINLILAVPVVVYSETIQGWFGFTPPAFAGDGLVAPVLGTLIFSYGGAVFLTGAWSEVHRRAPGMMLLVSLAITVAFGASAASTLGLFDLEFWWELSALVVVMLLGHWLEMRALGQARGALSALPELLPDEAERVRDGETERVALRELAVGDVVLVRPGGRVPADGEIVAGRAELDESMITGESKPVAKDEGDRVTAGTVATDSASASASAPWARRPRLRGSSDSWPRRSRRARARRRSPTGLPRCSSTSRWVPGWPPSPCGCSSETAMPR
jgi:Cu2+-exporting ATPase